MSNVEVKEMKDNYPEMIVENGGDLIFALDGDGIVRYINRKIEEFGYRRDEIIGKRADSFLISDDRRPDPLLLKNEIEETIHQYKLRANNGTFQVVEIAISPLKDDRGDGVGRVGVARDISPTGWLGAEDSTRMLPGFAHDVKSPLAALKLSLSILEQSAREDDLPILKIMNEKLNKLQEVMLKLLDLIPTDRD